MQEMMKAYEKLQEQKKTSKKDEEARIAKMVEQKLKSKKQKSQKEIYENWKKQQAAEMASKAAEFARQKKEADLKHKQQMVMWKEQTAKLRRERDEAQKAAEKAKREAKRATVPVVEIPEMEVEVTDAEEDGMEAIVLRTTITPSPLEQKKIKPTKVVKFDTKEEEVEHRWWLYLILTLFVVLICFAICCAATCNFLKKSNQGMRSSLYEEEEVDKRS